MCAIKNLELYVNVGHSLKLQGFSSQSSLQKSCDHFEQNMRDVQPAQARLQNIEKYTEALFFYGHQTRVT